MKSKIMTKKQKELALKRIEKNIVKFHPEGDIASLMRMRYREIKNLKV